VTEPHTHQLAHRIDRVITRTIGIAIAIYLITGIIIGALIIFGGLALLGNHTGQPETVVPTVHMPGDTCPDTGNGVTVPDPDTGLCPGD
jgi:hypothetical protein